MQQTARKAVLIVADCAEAVQAGAVGTTANRDINYNRAVGTTVFPTRNSFFSGLLRFGAKHGKISVVQKFQWSWIMDN